MSKQMDFQFSGAKLCEMMELVRERVGVIPKEKLDAALVEKFPDLKEQKMARATVIVLVKCWDTNRDYADVKKVIVWRNKDGKPADIQIEF